MSELFDNYCSNLEKRLSGIEKEEEAIAAVTEEVNSLLKDPTFLVEQLTEMAEGKMELLSTDYNDVTLYRSPEGRFSVRLFVWEAFVPYPVHDHGSWGVVGSLAGQVQETKYKRLDDAEEENYAHLEEIKKSVLTPGGITKVYPLNRGIHHMEAMEGKTALTLHTYGAPVRKGYIRGFVPDRKTTYRIFPPKYGPRIIGMKALNAINQDIAGKVMDRVESEGHPMMKEMIQVIRSGNP